VKLAASPCVLTPCALAYTRQLHADAGDAEGGTTWSLTNLRERLIKSGAKVAVTGAMSGSSAEVAVPRQMFAEILSLIGLLRAPPANEARGASGLSRTRGIPGQTDAARSPFGCCQLPATIASCPPRRMSV
jgi:hypothetical protein